MSEVDPYADLRGLLVPRSEETLGGRTLTVRPFDFGLLPAVADQVKAAKSFITTSADGAVDFDFVSLFAQQHGTAMELLQLLSGQEKEWLGKLPADEALFLFAVYVRVNADFFIQRLAPLLMLAWTSLASSASTPSTLPASSSPQEAGPTSSQS